jgi:hypothetical protein
MQAMPMEAQPNMIDPTEDFDQWLADYPDEAGETSYRADPPEFIEADATEWDPSWDEYWGDDEGGDQPRLRPISTGRPGMGPNPSIRYVYHLTDLERLRGIWLRGAVRPGEATTIGDKSLAAKRALYTVESSDQRRLAIGEATSCYFTARSPMLYSVKEKSGVESTVILRFSIAEIVRRCVFAFTDAHSCGRGTHAWSSAEDLAAIDTAAIRSPWWDESTKPRRMAEFLVFGDIELDLIDAVAVAYEGTADRVRAISKRSFDPVVRPDTFFLR